MARTMSLSIATFPVRDTSLERLVADSDTNRARGLHYFSPPDNSLDLRPANDRSPHSDVARDATSPSTDALDDLCGWHRDHGASSRSQSL